MRVLFYSQHSLGLGHFVRSAALARRLAADGRVVFVNGGALPDGIEVPEGLERVDLPPIGMDARSALVSLHPGLTVDAAFERRRETLIALLDRHRPDVVLVELFPFGRRKFEPELVPWLRAARHQPVPPAVVCSVRDLLVTGRESQLAFDDRARLMCDRYFDLVLVHSDPDVAPFDDSFRPSVALRTPLRHTGFIGRADPPPPVGRREGVVVSAGGGAVGAPLFRLAVEAHRVNWSRRRLRTTVVAGPLAPASELAWLVDAAAGAEGLTVLPHVPDLRVPLAGAAVSVSQCGYNTALDVIATRVPALVVPYGDDGENEQRRRAARLAARGLLRWEPWGRLTGDRLADAILETLAFTPAPARLLLDGADRTAEALRDLVAARRAAVPVGGAR